MSTNHQTQHKDLQIQQSREFLFWSRRETWFGLLTVQKPTLGDFYIAFHLLMVWEFQRYGIGYRVFSTVIRLRTGHLRSRGSIPSRVKPFISHTNGLCGPGQLSRYSDLLRAGRSGDRNPVGIRFHAPDRPWGQSSPLYNRYRFSFPGV